VVRAAPDVHPGFFTYETPDKPAKRQVLAEVVATLEGMIGRTLLDERVARLLEADDPELERELLAERATPPETIGVGLALGYFRRTRRRAARRDGRDDLAGTRGPALVRERTSAAARG
jgi:hypothetical protein